MPYRLPNPQERRALFAWLKQASSLTAWERLFGFHQAFVDNVEQGFEHAQRHPPAAGHPFVPAKWMSDVLKSHAAFRAALERLRKGDRRCFHWRDASGHFERGLREMVWWRDMYGRYEYMSGPDFSPSHSPLWPQMEKAMNECMDAYSDIGVVLQRRHTDVPAPIRNVDAYHSVSGDSLFKHLCRQPTLPEVPEVLPAVYVKTGKTVPTDGIWEPVVLPRFGATETLDGCLNYLHADSLAPTIAFPEDGQRKEGRPTVWRLVWADERYGGKPVPEEEAHYVFVRPVPAPAAP